MRGGDRIQCQKGDLIIFGDSRFGQRTRGRKELLPRTDEGWWVKVSFIKTRKMGGGKIAEEARRCSFGNKLRLKRLRSTRKDPATRQLEVSASSSGQGSRQRLATAELSSEAEVGKAGRP